MNVNEGLFLNRIINVKSITVICTCIIHDIYEECDDSVDSLRSQSIIIYTGSAAIYTDRASDGCLANKCYSLSDPTGPFARFALYCFIMMSAQQN